MRRVLAVAIAVSQLTGWAGLLGRGDDEPTLANLQKQEIRIEKKPLTAADRAEVIKNYKALLQLNPDRRLSSEATRLSPTGIPCLIGER